MPHGQLQFLTQQHKATPKFSHSLAFSHHPLQMEFQQYRGLGGHCNVTGRLGRLQASEGHVPSCSGKRLQMSNTTPLGGSWALS